MLYIASKQLLSRKKQTLLILLGIGFGTMLYVTIAGVQLGLRKYISDALLNNTAHILITGAENEIKKDEIQNLIYSNESFIKWIISPSGKRDESKLSSYYSWYSKLMKDPDVEGFSPRLRINVLAKRGKLTGAISLTGTNPLEQIKISTIKDYIREGSFEALDGGGNKIVLGIKIAENFGVRLGQYIDLSVANGNSVPFKVVGIIKFGDERIDASTAFANLKDVQAINKTPGRVSEIAVAIKDKELSSEIADKWSMYTNDTVKDWKEANKMFMEMIKMQDVVRYFITFSILVVAAFGIYNVLSIMINQKRKEIAILRSIGYGPKRILELIMYQGVFLGTAGGVLGMFLGFLVSKMVESIDLGFEIGKSNHLIIDYGLDIYLTAFVAAFFASIIASIIPAYSASRLTPIDIIRE